MVYDNEMSLILDSNSKNEGLARVCVSAFVAQLDPLLADISDIKTAISEAVTNSIIHGYDNTPEKGKVYVNCKYKGNEIYIEIKDDGKGIENIEEAREALFTSKPDMERSGMGFTVMENFMDSIEVISEVGKGTTIKMTKKLSSCC